MFEFDVVPAQLNSSSSVTNSFTCHASPTNKHFLGFAGLSVGAKTLGGEVIPVQTAPCSGEELSFNESVN